MSSSKRVVYVVHDRTTSARPGILTTAFESVEKAIAHVNGFRAQHPDNPGPLTWSTGPGWADGRDAAGNTVFYVSGLTVAPDNEPTFYENPAR
ncbi:hypothetical protein [Amycolatopsis sp. NPDC004079]|uniref:hypothetical protein n=1 Tax=Amycolatopsis sp. NPDC004079 TaxID=3154549 RepID=UPI00339F0715